MNIKYMNYYVRICRFVLKIELKAKKNFTCILSPWNEFVNVLLINSYDITRFILIQIYKRSSPDYNNNL